MAITKSVMIIATRLLSERKSVTDRGCWIWTGYCGMWGYGQVKIENKKYAAHRISFEIYTGVDPRGMIIRHSCDTPSCFNPEHLDVGSHEDNVRDRVDRDRSAHGDHHGRSKLTESDIPVIWERLIKSDSNSKIATDYGVDPRAIGQIRNGETWTKVTSALSGNPQKAVTQKKKKKM